MEGRRLRFAASIIIGLVVGLTEGQAQRLEIHNNEGAITSYFLNDLNKLTFSSGTINIVKRGGILESYTMTDVRNLDFMLVTTGIEDTEPAPSDISFLLFPNPVNEILHIRLNSGAGLPGLIEIFSMDGKRISTHRFNMHTEIYDLNLAHLPKGIYICRINQGTQYDAARFVKQ